MNTEKTISQAAQAAAQWWAKAVCDGKPQDNGDPFMSSLMAVMPLSRVDKNAGVAAKFEAELAAIVEDRLKAGRVVLDVDYHPDHLLQSAADKAGLDSQFGVTWPWKTIMFVSPTEVKVSRGYGQAPEVIYPEVKA